MTKEELKSSLKAGKTMDELFHYTEGEDCLIFKADDFNPDNAEEIIYIPDISLNEIPMDRALESNEEIEEVIGVCYDAQDFMYEADGDVEMAKRLFEFCTWQHPSSAVDEIDDDEDEV